MRANLQNRYAHRPGHVLRDSNLHDMSSRFIGRLPNRQSSGALTFRKLKSHEFFVRLNSYLIRKVNSLAHGSRMAGGDPVAKSDRAATLIRRLLIWCGSWRGSEPSFPDHLIVGSEFRGLARLEYTEQLAILRNDNRHFARSVVHHGHPAATEPNHGELRRGLLAFSEQIKRTEDNGADYNGGGTDAGIFVFHNWGLVCLGGGGGRFGGASVITNSVFVSLVTKWPSPFASIQPGRAFSNSFTK